uniref:Uncharacterized protein n=1 Tax=Lygus hesperus TaxID=30085 RepID=A0A146L3M5_LYGHE
MFVYRYTLPAILPPTRIYSLVYASLSHSRSIVSPPSAASPYTLRSRQHSSFLRLILLLYWSYLPLRFMLNIPLLLCSHPPLPLHYSLILGYFLSFSSFFFLIIFNFIACSHLLSCIHTSFLHSMFSSSAPSSLITYFFLSSITVSSLLPNSSAPSTL